MSFSLETPIPNTTSTTVGVERAEYCSQQLVKPATVVETPVLPVILLQQPMVWIEEPLWGGGGVLLYKLAALLQDCCKNQSHSCRNHSPLLQLLLRKPLPLLQKPIPFFRELLPLLRAVARSRPPLLQEPLPLLHRTKPTVAGTSPTLARSSPVVASTSPTLA